ncbi:MAG TPA: (S)-benzoin forming benzil reductase [Nitrospinota bacterium]|nr:(S)-benzoin forming benzil reductase [Nitrospinota bacterium]
MRNIIISGATRGLGKALARGLSHPNTKLFLIARGKLEETKKAAEAKGAQAKTYNIDLADTLKLEETIEKIFSHIDKDSIESFYLINNAAVLEPVGPSWKNNTKLVKYHFLVNTVAPLVLSNLFIKHLKDFPLDKRIINISSGAALRPIYGWSSYCCSKTALDMITSCISLEQEREKYPVKIISLNPGVMDTGMQEQIRKVEKEDFPDKDCYVRLLEEGKLPNPEWIADKIVKLLESDDFPNGRVLTINDI